MYQHFILSPNHRSYRSQNSFWLVSKIRRIRASRREQKEFQQQMLIISAVLMAFFLGFFFLGPGLN